MPFIKWNHFSWPKLHSHFSPKVTLLNWANLSRHPRQHPQPCCAGMFLGTRMAVVVPGAATVPMSSIKSWKSYSFFITAWNMKVGCLQPQRLLSLKCFASDTKESSKPWATARLSRRGLWGSNKDKLQNILHFPFTLWYPPSRLSPAFALWCCPTPLVCPGKSHCRLPQELWSVYPWIPDFQPLLGPETLQHLELCRNQGRFCFLKQLAST